MDRPATTAIALATFWVKTVFSTDPGIIILWNTVEFAPKNEITAVPLWGGEDAETVETQYSRTGEEKRRELRVEALFEEVDVETGYAMV